MTDNLEIINSQIVFSYSRNLDIRKRVFEFEEILRNYFVAPFRTVAIPDEMDSNIPRFESQSIHGYSKLKVSQNRITLATNFDKKLTKNEKVDYLLNKRKIVSKLATSEKMEFFAYVVEMRVDIDDREINDVLIENTGAKALSGDCMDFSLLYSRVLKNDYYINIKCSKYKEQKVLLDKTKNSLQVTGDFIQGISVTVDINTKQYFESNGSFNNQLFQDTENELFEILNNKNLQDYLKGEI